MNLRALLLLVAALLAGGFGFKGCGGGPPAGSNYPGPGPGGGGPTPEPPTYLPNRVLSGAVSVAAGYGHSCAALLDGTVWCWGRSFAGELGNGEAPGPGVFSATPVQVLNLTSAMQVAAGLSFSCALLRDGTAHCWGYDYGQGPNPEPVPQPAPVSGLDSAVALTAGNKHACAIRSDGSAACWGWGYFGAAPLYSTGAVSVPLSGISSLGAGDTTTCSVLDGGEARCWGAGYFGQLGDGQGQYSEPPVEPALLASFRTIDTGTWSTCATTTADDLFCWGQSHWFSDEYQSNSPIHVVTSAGSPVNLSVGYSHACFIDESGLVRCFGSNSIGQLGNGGSTDSRLPTALSSPSTYEAISSLYDHTCALTTAGDVDCWGSNYMGQTGQ